MGILIIIMYRMRKLRSLKFPYILQFKDSAEIETDIYMATEEVDSLATWIEYNKFMDVYIIYLILLIEYH